MVCLHNVTRTWSVFTHQCALESVANTSANADVSSIEYSFFNIFYLLLLLQGFTILGAPRTLTLSPTAMGRVRTLRCEFLRRRRLATILRTDRLQNDVRSKQLRVAIGAFLL